MTLTDYAKYLLNVCGKRFTHLYQRHYLESTPTLPSLSALLSYLKTQTATIYAHLQSRLQGDPTSGIPSVPLTTPLTLVNLLPNLQKLATRKIDAGTSTQIPEGISLVRLLCDTTAASAVTELIDTNTGWTLNKVLPISLYPNLTKITIGCNLVPTGSLGSLISSTTITSATCFELETLYNQGRDRLPTFNLTNGKLYLPKLVHLYTGTMYNSQLGYIADCKEIHAPLLSDIRNGVVHNSTNIEKVVLGTVHTWYHYTGNNGGYVFGKNCPNLKYVEFGYGTDCNIQLTGWNPTEIDATFLTNFRQYLFLRLADRTATTALTLTLSSAVYTALTTETSTLAELGITTLTDKEQTAGITLATAYNTWLDTYRAAINWNITNAG